MRKTLSATATDNRKLAVGTFAVATIGVVAATPAVSHAAVKDKVVNLTTSFAPDYDAADGNIFIDFSSMTASTSSSGLSNYQYRIVQTVTNSADDISVQSTGSAGTISNNSSLCPTAAHLTAGDTIDSSGTMLTGSSGIYSGAAPITDWSLGDRGYVGMSFALADGTHFGWADIQLNPDATTSLYHFGYETTPDTAITTPGFVAVPEANPLELLALGAAALGVFRLVTTKRQEAETPAA